MYRRSERVSSATCAASVSRGHNAARSFAQPMALKDGRPIFRFTVPANGSVTVRYTVADR